MMVFSASKFTKSFDIPLRFKLLISLGNDSQFFVDKYSVVMRDGCILSDIKSGLEISFNKILKGKKKGESQTIFTQKVGAGNLYIGFI